MKTFTLKRNSDEFGVSGTGIVLEGCVFTDGTCVIRWCTPNTPPTTGVYDTFEHFMKIHVDSHPTNNSEIIWDKVSKLKEKLKRVFTAGTNGIAEVGFANYKEREAEAQFNLRQAYYDEV